MFLSDPMRIPKSSTSRPFSAPSSDWKRGETQPACHESAARTGNDSERADVSPPCQGDSTKQFRAE